MALSTILTRCTDASLDGDGDGVVVLRCALFISNAKTNRAGVRPFGASGVDRPGCDSAHIPGGDVVVGIY